LSKKRQCGSNKNEKHDQDIFLNWQEAEIICKDMLHGRLETDPCNQVQISVLDACCGNGAFSKGFIKFFNNDDDILLSLADIKKYDMLNITVLHNYIYGNVLEINQQYDIILCNPPWAPVDNALEIYLHMQSLLSPSGIMLFIINSTFLYQGQERANLLKYDAVKFLPRYTFEGSGKPLLDPVVIRASVDSFRNNYLHIPKSIAKVKNESCSKEKNLFSEGKDVR